MSNPSTLVRFNLSPKMKFAIKTALAITISYIVSLAMSWGQPFQGAIAIMVIASVGPLRDSLDKGIWRIIGTVAGAIVGLGLTALFPQDRFFYFLSISIASAIVIYLYRTSRFDNSVWMILLVVMIFIFDGGNHNNRFIYAVDRSWNTAFGILVYALINIYLWPDTTSRLDRIKDLNSLWLKLWREPSSWDISILSKIEALEGNFLKSVRAGATEYLKGLALDTPRWRTIQSHILPINQTFQKLEILNFSKHSQFMRDNLKDFKELQKNIEELLDKIDNFWIEPYKTTLSSLYKPHSIKEELNSLSIDNGTKTEIIALFTETLKLQESLYNYLKHLKKIASMELDYKETNYILPKSGLFRLGEFDDYMSVLISLIIYWSALLIWYFGQFGDSTMGYTMVGLALIMSLIIVFEPINPMLLVVAFIISFIFSILGYVFILPNLDGGLELGLYIFIYMFLVFYLVPPPLSMVIAQGLVFQYIMNDIMIDFRLFLILMLDFALFLGVLLIFYYLPISMRPENRVLAIKRYIDRLINTLEQKRDTKTLEHLSWAIDTIKKWAVAIDYKYFQNFKRELIDNYLDILKRYALLNRLLIETKKRIRELRIDENSSIDSSSDLEKILLISELNTIKQELTNQLSKLQVQDSKINWQELKKGRF